MEGFKYVPFAGALKHILDCLPACLPACLLAYLPAYLPTYLPNYLPTYYQYINHI